MKFANRILNDQDLELTSIVCDKLVHEHQELVNALNPFKMTGVHKVLLKYLPDLTPLYLDYINRYPATVKRLDFLKDLGTPDQSKMVDDRHSFPDGIIEIEDKKYHDFIKAHTKQLPICTSLIQAIQHPALRLGKYTLLVTEILKKNKEDEGLKQVSFL